MSGNWSICNPPSRQRRTKPGETQSPREGDGTASFLSTYHQSKQHLTCCRYINITYFSMCRPNQFKCNSFLHRTLASQTPGRGGKRISLSAGLVASCFNLKQQFPLPSVRKRSAVQNSGHRTFQSQNGALICCQPATSTVGMVTSVWHYTNTCTINTALLWLQCQETC